MAVITISRGIKSGGEELARMLSKRLNYSTINREIIAECCRKYNVIEGELLEELEATPSLWHRLTRGRSRQLIFIKCALLEAVKQDNIVYFGHAGPLFLAGLDHVFKIRLETPREERIETAARELDISHDDAVTYIMDVDKSRDRWIKLLYDENWRDPSLYDLVVNCRNISLETICDLVALSIEKGEFRTTEESMRVLNNISLACEVQAAIASDDKIWEQSITVTAQDGDVTIRGIVKNKELSRLIMETALQVKGVKNCYARIGHLNDPVK